MHPELFSIFIHKLSMTTSNHILILISLRPNTSPRSIRSLLRTASEDTPGVTPRLITCSDLNCPPGSSIPNNSASFSNNTEQGDLLISF